VVISLERGADLHTAQLMPLPLTVGKRAVKRVCVCVCVYLNIVTLPLGGMQSIMMSMSVFLFVFVFVCAYVCVFMSGRSQAYLEKN